MRNHFEGGVSGKYEGKKVTVNPEVISGGTQQDQVSLTQERRPKTLENISQAAKKIKLLEGEKAKLIGKHRDSVQELRGLDVREKLVGSNGRSETFNEILSPIEAEISKIAGEISDLRAENDIVQKPKEILRKRIERLNELLYLNIKDFLSTETGEHFLSSMDNQNAPGLAPESGSVSIYSRLICEYFSKNNGQNTRDESEFKSFENRNTRIIKIIESIESKLSYMGTRE